MSGVPEGMKNWWCYCSPVLELQKLGGAINGISILNWQKLMVLYTANDCTQGTTKVL